MSVIVKGGGGENVKAEVTAQVPIIQGIADNFGVEITTPTGTNKQILQGNNANLESIKTNAKRAGKYVWKKYSGKPKITAKITVDFLIPSEIKIPTTFVVTSSEPTYLPISELDVSSFDGLTLKQTIDSNSYRTFTFHGDGTVTIQTDSSATTYADGTFTYDKSAGRITWTPTTAWGQYLYEFSSVYVEKTNELLDYVVSDSETAYPDGGEQGGYWYEKVVEGKAGVDFGEITLTTAQETVTVAHNLGIIPSFVVLVPKNLPSTLPSKSIYLVANNTVFYGAGGLVKGNFSPTKTDTQITFGSIYISGYGVNTTYPAWNYYWFAIA